MKTKPKTYEIDTFEKLLNVANGSNVQNLAIDLAQWLIYCTNTIEQLREKHPELCKGKTNHEIAKCTFIWIDDGKNDLNNVKLVKKETGEVVNVKLKGKSKDRPTYLSEP